LLGCLAIYWAKWPTTIEVFGVIGLGLIFYIIYEVRQPMGHQQMLASLKGARWLAFELLWLTVMSLIGSHQFGGSGWVPYPSDFLFVILGSLGCYFLGIHDGYFGLETQTAWKLNRKSNY
jgi:hypothetical protein